jgi:serine/threonine protein kinase
MNLEGLQLGGYRLISLLGKGGMAEVWLAEQVVLNRKVAVKVIRETTEAVDIKIQVARFSREAQTLAQLDHVNILPVIDYGSAQDYLYLVTPYVPGGSLLGQLKRSWVSGSQALDICQDILAGLSYAHQKGIIHRDLKPGNILLRDGGGRAVIADFGVAKIENDTLSLTQHGMIIGSPEYMAPEQFLGHSYYSSDLYSLSVLLYQMFSGHVPYRGTNATEIGMRHLTDQIPLPNPQVPEPLGQFLHKALQKMPENRFTTAESMQAALLEVKGLLNQHQFQSKPLHPQIAENVAAFPTRVIQNKIKLNKEPTLHLSGSPGQDSPVGFAVPAPVAAGPNETARVPFSEANIIEPDSSSPVGPDRRTGSEPEEPESRAVLPGAFTVTPEPRPVQVSQDPESNKTLKPSLPPELPDETNSQRLPAVSPRKPKTKQRVPLKLILGGIGLLFISVFLAVGSVIFANKNRPGILPPVVTSSTSPVVLTTVTTAPVTTASTTGTASNSLAAGTAIARGTPALSLSVPAATTLSPASPPAGNTIPPATITPVTTRLAGTSPALTNPRVALNPANGTAAQGSATLTDKGDGTFSVVVNMIGLGQGIHPSHIHQGSCQAEGPIRFELNSLTAGPAGTASATTVIKGSLDALRSGNFYVDVANVSGSIFYVASCGNLRF